MNFHLTPILKQMEQLYHLPRNRKRFETYLLMLQGETKDEMVLPIAGYNPMGKELALEKVQALITLGAEDIAQQEINRINNARLTKEERIIQVVINLTDDVEGSWSSRYTTDYTSKFDLNALVKRDFCTPYFWTSETYTEKKIAQRIRAYLYRTLYAIDNGKPKTLKQHLDQESFVYRKLEKERNEQLDREKVQIDQEFEVIDSFFQEHADSEDYSLIFNFFYGDKASQSLGYASYGRKEFDGFTYAQFLATAR